MRKYIRQITAASIFSFLLLNTPCSELPINYKLSSDAKEDSIIINTASDTILFDDYFISSFDKETNQEPKYFNLNIVSYETEKPEIEEAPKPVIMRRMEIPEVDISQEEIHLIALLTDAEAGGESEYGQRLVIDTVLNRLLTDGFPKTVYDVINQPNQYSPVSSGRIWNRVLRDDLVRLVEEECIKRTNKEVLFFRTKYYHSFGTPMFQVGAHYFSTL